MVTTMRTLVAITAAAALGLVGTSAAFANHKPGHPEHPPKGKKSKPQTQSQKPAKVTICHRTLSTKHPTVTIRVSERSKQAHLNHGDTEGSCQNGEPRGATRTTTALTAVSGATGSGSAVVDVRLLKKSSLVCFTLNVTGVTATAAHIHASSAQTIGGQNFAANAIVVPLKTPNANGVARGCTKTSLAIGQALLANPGAFYVNVHSASFPGGQVQGPLALA
jgi:CHRD domain